jgi:hypothetical protein
VGSLRTRTTLGTKYTRTRNAFIYFNYLNYFHMRDHQVARTVASSDERRVSSSSSDSINRILVRISGRLRLVV